MICDIYYNVHKQCLSIRYKGKVIGHTDCIRLFNAKLIVSEPGRQRVLATGRKNVHAIVRGERALKMASFDFSKAIEVTYNPRKHKTFIQRSNNKPVYEASDILIRGQKIYAIIGH